MKIVSLITSSLALLAAAVLPAAAQRTYLGTGNANGSATDGTKITSVVVNNDANNITFTINSSQTMDAYIFYAVDIQIIGQAANGYTGFSNPIWSGSPTLGISSGENAVLDFNSDGASNTHGIGFKYVSGSWVAGSSVAYDAGGAGSTFATLTVPLSTLGLQVGDSFYFDAVSTYTSWQNGYPQSAYGALDSISGYPADPDGSGNNTYAPWNYYNNAADPTHYDSATDASGTTFGTAASMYSVVPEPATFALFGMGGLLMLLRRRVSAR